MNRKDYKDLEGVKAPKRGLIRIVGGDKGGELYKAAVFSLVIS